MPKIKTNRIQSHPEWLESDLKNWVRWCWLGKLPHPLPKTQCASLEGNYIHERHAEERVEDEYRPPLIILDRAMLVQDVYDHLPPDPQLVMRAEYPQRHNSGRAEYGQVGAARRLKISLQQYEGYLSVAIYRVMRGLE